MSSPESPRQDYDQSLKRLLLRAHDAFLALVAPGLTWRGERSPELPETKRQADIVWEVEQPAGRPGILHIELQTKPEANIGERMAHYGLRLFERHRLPVLSVVVFLRKTANVPRSPFVLTWMGQERLRYEFEVIRLWEMAPESVLRPAGVLPLAARGAHGPDNLRGAHHRDRRADRRGVARASRSQRAGWFAGAAGEFARAAREAG